MGSRARLVLYLAILTVLGLALVWGIINSSSC